MEVWKTGVMIAPVEGSGCCPACILSVPKRRFGFSFFIVSMLLYVPCLEKAINFLLQCSKTSSDFATASR